MQRTSADIAIPLQLLQAYLDTSYHVSVAENSFSMRIGQHSEELATLHSKHGSSASAFITACNPLGSLLSNDANQAAMERLVGYLEERLIPWLPGAGEIVGGSWPPEPSVLAVGVSLADARDLCKIFEQNAVVWASSDAVPALLLHPDAVLTHTEAASAAQGTMLPGPDVNAAARIAEACSSVGTARGVEAFVRNSSGLCHRSIEQRIRAAVSAALGTDR